MLDQTVIALLLHISTLTFDEFHVMLNEYQYHIITMFETWLKDNQKLLDYIDIPGYNLEYANRDNR